MAKKKKSKRHPHEDLKKEMAELAKQVVGVLKDPVVRTEVKGIGHVALSGLRATGGRIVQALRKAKASEATHQLESRAKRVYGLGKKKGGKTAQRVSADMVNKLKHLGVELQKLSKNLHHRG